MSTPFLETVLTALKAEMPELSTAGLSAARFLLRTLADDVARWTTLAASGSLTPQELQWLAAARMDVVRMKALEQSGLTLAAFDDLRNKLISQLVGMVLPGSVER